VDTALCELQIREKSGRRAQEREADRLAVEEERRIAKVIAGAELDHRMQSKQELRHLRSCWEQQADPRQRLEADLNPRIAKQENVNPKECGASSCQWFAGEDQKRFERKRMQERQMYHNARHQADQKKARELVEKENDRKYAKDLINLDKAGAVWDKQETDMRRQEAYENRRTNDFIVAQKKSELMAARAKEKRESHREVECQLTSNFLNEVSDGSKQGYKGMTPEERMNILVQNQTTIKERARLKQEAVKEDRLWARQARNINRVILQDETMEQEKRDHAAKELQAAHKHQMTEAQRTREEARRNARGSIQGGWFTQFGTSHR